MQTAQTVLIVVHLLIVLALIVTVLLQRSEGGLGLGGGGSGGVSGFMTGRGQANALTRATAILAVLFFTTSITLAVMAHHSAAPRSILDGGSDPVQPAQQQKQPENADGLLDTLRQQGGQQGGQGSGAPAPQAPAENAPSAPSPSAPDAPQSR